MNKTLPMLILAAISMQAQAASYLETFQGMSGALCDPYDICVNDTTDHQFLLRWQNSPPKMSYSTTVGFQIKTGWTEFYPVDPNLTMAVKRLTFTINSLAPPASYGTVTLSIWNQATNSYRPYRNYTMLPNRPKTLFYYGSNAPEMQALKRFQLSATNPVTSFTVNAMNADLF
ncbi:MAG: hypothetical protein PHE55_11080 [Methylococcaceae bacterium]|nr:hypothetical protein [Methylococcaceae bacterium]